MVGVAEQEVAGCLGGPGPGGVGGGAGVEDLSGGDVDEEQHVAAAEQGGVDGEEVAGHGRLGVQELRPGDVGSVRGGVDAGGLEDLPHGGGRDVVAEAGQFAMDAAVAPGRVLISEAKNELSDLGCGGWSSRSS